MSEPPETADALPPDVTRDHEGWAGAVQDRIADAKRFLQWNNEVATIFTGTALVLAAIACGLLVNRILEGSSAALLLHPDTLMKLCVGGAVAIWVAQLVFRLGINRGTPRGEQWKPLNGIAIALTTIAAVLWWSGSEDKEAVFRFGHAPIGIGLIAISLGLIVAGLYYSARGNRVEQDIADLQFESDLLRHAVKPFQTRAEKLLSINQIQLRRYYELNLQQARAVFIVGICCIGAGAVVVATTFWLVYWLGKQPVHPEGISATYTQIVVALVGGVGTLLTNYVASLYFRLHGSIGESLMAFHNQLASTHELFFANVLASSIEEKKERAEVLVRLATAIAERKLEKAAVPASKSG